MKAETKEKNEDILDFVVKLGGGYIWETDIFAVNLLESPIRDEEALVLSQLTGVGQIALNAASLSEAALNDIAMIPGLSLWCSHRQI